MEFVLLRWTKEGTIAHEVLPYLPLIPAFLVSNFTANLFFEKNRVAAWSAHDVCPECGYNLTGNTSGVCPECGMPVLKKPSD